MRLVPRHPQGLSPRLVRRCLLAAHALPTHRPVRATAGCYRALFVTAGRFVVRATGGARMYGPQDL